MSTPLGMFDRENLVKMLDRDCLGDRGCSAAVVGAHKVGKTHLLKHIASRPHNTKESLYCNIDLYLLRASLEHGESLSDHVFLRFFLSKLYEGLDEWLDSQIEVKRRWDADITKAEQDLAALEPVAAANAAVETVRAQMRDSVNALKQGRRQLESLENVKDEIKDLLTAKEQLAIHKVVYIFNRLQKLNKRVILIIDEFDQMLRENRFSDELFSFLRGANNEGKIIALVTSRVHLMDESLHGDSATPDRMSLFNHFQLQFLDPFDGREAIDFLEWSREADPPLSQEEKAYIQKLGGGSPYFLQQAREEFLLRGRPNNPTDCDNFEKRYLARVFDDGFKDIWNRLIAPERSALRRVADGIEPDYVVGMKLEREGYVISTDTGLVLFSPLFYDFVKRQPRFSRSARSAAAILSPSPIEKPPADATAPVVVPATDLKVDLPYQVIPASLYFAQPELAEVGVITVTNHTKEAQRVKATWSLVDYSQPTTNMFDVPPGTHTFKLNVVIQKDRLVSLKVPVPTQVTCDAVVLVDNAQPVIKTEVVRLLPRDNFLMARWDTSKEQLVDFSWLISAWVNSNEVGLQAIRKRASEIDSAFGQKVPSGEKGWARIKTKVEALYTALSEYGLTYDDHTMIFHNAENDYIQRVRMISEMLEDRVANCLDGAVLFASLLAKSDLDPAILLTRGHAMVGWKDRKGSDFRWEFLETTGLSRVPFSDAWEAGQRTFRRVADFFPEADSDAASVLNAKQFAILVDVRKVWQQRRISPL